MRESQSKGLEGKGTSEKTYSELMEDSNQEADTKG